MEAEAGASGPCQGPSLSLKGEGGPPGDSQELGAPGAPKSPSKEALVLAVPEVTFAAVEIPGTVRRP